MDGPLGVGDGFGGESGVVSANVVSEVVAESGLARKLVPHLLWWMTATSNSGPSGLILVSER